MKKLFIVFFVIAFAVVLTGCGKKNQVTTIIVPQEQVQKEVNGWTVYTNPLVRYELRHPKSWEVHKADADGQDVSFYPRSKVLSDKYKGALRIQSFVNWKVQYTLEKYAAEEAPQNYYDLGFEQEAITVDELSGVWFKGVTGLYETNPDLAVDVVLLDGGDRIIEIHLMDRDDTTLTLFNSLNFYGTKTLDDLEGASQ